MTRISTVKIFMVSSMVGLMMGLILLVSLTLDGHFGHMIAIASFAATTVTIFLNAHQRASQPVVIFTSYVLAASIGYLATLIPSNVAIQSSVALFSLVLVLLLLDLMHPPAVAYAFGFILTGYGLLEVFLTIPALFVYFIALAVVIWSVEKVLIWVGLISGPPIKKTAVSGYEKIGNLVHTLVPYALVILFISLTVDFLYPALIEPFSLYLTILDIAIVSLFIVDLVFLYRKATTVPEFIKQNWLDIIATIPFFITFRFMQGASLLFSLISRGSVTIGTDFARFTRFARPLARSPRFVRMLDHLDQVGL